jgi:hypothetical protein
VVKELNVHSSFHGSAYANFIPASDGELHRWLDYSAGFSVRLRKLHAETWDQLGKPVVFLNSGMLNTIRFIRFMWHRSYESLPDEKTVAFGRFLRAFLIYYMILLLLCLVIAFLVVKPHKS